MICRLAMILALFVGWVPVSFACGPFFDDAHHGQAEDPLQGSLESWYLRLIRPDDDLTMLRQRGAALRQRALDCEATADWAGAAIAWRAALADLAFDAHAIRTWELRAVQDRCALLPLVGVTMSPAQWTAYKAAAVPADPVALALLAEDRNPELAAAALTTLAWEDLRAGRIAAAEVRLHAALASAPHGVKANEISYLLVVAPCFAHLREDGRVDQPSAVMAALSGWIEAHPTSPWQPYAISWLAGLRYRQGEIQAAVLAWQALVVDPQQHQQFIPAVESLRGAYRRLRRDPPAWLAADPRHAAAFAWHAVTDRCPVEQRDAALALLGPALVAFSEPALDGAMLAMLAQTCYQAGQDESALLLARRALAVGGGASAGYLAARLECAAGRPEAAAPLIDALPASKPALVRDLLLRLGSAYEQRHDWMNALSAYVRADSQMDVMILCDGEIPLPAFEILVHAAAAHPTLGSPAVLPGLRQMLGKRLVRAGRLDAALPVLDEESRLQCTRLLALEAEVAAADDSTRAARTYALARFWYEPGRSLVFNHQYWHQWASHPARMNAQRWSELEAMTTYQRAYPLFRAIAERDPASPEAPEALFYAAHCRYWLCDQTYLRDSPAWRTRSREESFWDQGDELLRQLARQYPNHALASHPHVQRAINGERPTGR